MQQGEIPSPRAGHAGVTIGETWFILGRGDNKSGIGVSETVVLNMSTLIWSVVTTVQGRVPLASEDAVQMHQVKCNRKKAMQWVSVQCPKQPSTFECGYYIMKYLQDAHDPHVFEHNVNDLSRLRDEWDAYVAKLIVAYNNQASRLKEKATVGQKHG
ncbi:hypothetical protein OROGR_013568 [Orobanche gracilis]